MLDTHIHSSDFSPDGSDAMEAMILTAIDRGVVFIALTDHLDLLQDGSPPKQMADLKAYRNRLTDMQKKYRGKIEIAAGLEAGFVQKNALKMNELIGGLNFDFIINSVHEADNIDCYYREFYAERKKFETYSTYFEAVLRSLDAPYPFHAVGHLGYVERTAPYADKIAHYREFSEVLDAILKKIVSAGKILELNTNVYNDPKIPWLPNDEILRRYRTLGGTRITFGSDAHQTVRIGDKYQAACDYLKSLGFEGLTVTAGGKERFMPFGSRTFVASVP